MKKIKDNKQVFALNATFAEGIDYSEKEGMITQIYINSRKTSVPMIVTAKGSEAKLQGIDAVFPVCSQKCGEKMRESLALELATFKGVKNTTLQ